MTANVENLIRNKLYGSHREMMQDYLKRLNKDDNAKVFCFNSQDEHIRRVLLKHNWIENVNSSSMVYDLKWTYVESVDEVRGLLEG